MTKQIIETVDVDVPVTTAYNQWTQFESFPQFMDGVDEVIQVDDTSTHWKISIGGVEQNSTRRSPNNCQTSGWPGGRLRAPATPVSSPFTSSAMPAAG